MAGPSRAILLATAALLFVGGVSAQTSCVQVVSHNFDGICPCDAGSPFAFTMAGETVIAQNTVRI